MNTQGHPALSSGESKYRLLAEISPEMIYIISPDGYVKYMNPVAAQQFGDSPDAVVGKHLREIFPPERAEGHFQAILEVVRTRQEIQREIETEFPSGKRWIEARLAPMMDETGRVIGILGLSNDVTKRKAAEAALRESKEKYRELADALPQIVYEMDLQGNLTYVNRHAYQMVGFSEVDFHQGINVFQLLAPEDHERARRNIGRLIKGDAVGASEYTFVRKGGRQFPVEIHSILMRKEGQVVGLRGFILDIAERQQAEEALLRNERLFRALIEHSYDAITMISADGIVLFDSPSVTRTLGYSPAERLGKRAFDFVIPEEREQMVQGFAQFVQQPGSIMNYQGRFLHKDGTVRWIEGVRTNLLNEPTIQAVVVNYRDFAERRRAEQVRDILYQIGEDVSTTKDLDDLLACIHARIKTVMYAENCYIALYDAETDLVSFPFFVDQYDPAPEPRAKRKGFTEYVLRTGRPLLLTPELYEELVKSGEVEPIGTPPISWLGAPLFMDGKPYGALVVQSYEEGRIFKSFEQDLLAAIGHQVAMVIERKRKDDALRSSEEKYRMLIDNIQDGVFIVQDGCFQFANGAFARAVGYSIQELVGLELKQIIAPEDWEWTSDLYRRLMAEESPPGEFEVRGLHRDGVSRIIANLNLGLIQYRGRPAAMGTIKDITERKQMEREREMIQRINQLLLGELDAERALNGISSELLEFVPHETIALSLIQKDSDQVEYIVSALDGGTNSAKEQHSHHYFEPYQKSLTQQILYDKREAIQHDLKFGSTKFERHLGDLRMKSYLAVPVINAGVPLGMLFLASVRSHAFQSQHEQILQRIQPQLALYIQHHRLIEKMFDSEAKYRSLFENSNDVIYILQDRRFIFVNRKFEELLGYKLEEISRADFNFMQLVAPESVPIIENRARRLALGEKLPTRYEFKGLTKAGKEIEFEANVSYISYDGKTATQGILRDISERRSFEARQQEMQLELIQRAKLSSIGMLSAGIAHNMNLPLQGIINHIELLKMTRSDVPYLDDILTQAQRIAAIINNMLFKSRQEQDQGLRELDLNQMLVEELTFLNADLEFKHRVVKQYHFDPDLPKIQGVYSDFSQAILNIIRNALDAMYESHEKRLTVRTEARPDKEILIEVADTGCGIAPEHLDQIFSPFFSTKPVAGMQNGTGPSGTGLGLSSAYQLLKKYHSRYDVQSRPGEGTVFRVYIPTSRQIVKESAADLVAERS